MQVQEAVFYSRWRIHVPVRNVLHETSRTLDKGELPRADLTVSFCERLKSHLNVCEDLNLTGGLDSVATLESCGRS